MKNFLLLLFLFFYTTAYANTTPTKNILIFGDSLSTSYGMPTETGWVALLEQKLQTTFAEYQIINASISGETTLGGLNRIKQVLETHRPEIVFLELGANDGLRGASIKSIYNNLEAIIQICLENHASVIIAGMQLPPNYGITYTQKFQDIFTRLAENHQIELIPFLLAGFEDNHDFFQADGIHPNEIAQEKIVDNVWSIFKGMLIKNE